MFKSNRTEKRKLEDLRMYSQHKTMINNIFDRAIVNHDEKEDIEYSLSFVSDKELKVSTEVRNKLFGYIDCMFFNYQSTKLIYGSMIEDNVYTNEQLKELVKEKNCSIKELTDSITERGMYYIELFPMYVYELW